MTEEEKDRMKLIASNDRKIDQLFNESIKEIAPYLKDIQIPDKTSRLWKVNPKTKKRIDSVMEEFDQELMSTLQSAQKDGWNLANDHKDKEVKDYIKGLSVASEMQEGFFSRNEEALQAFMYRKDNGIGLSDRVWKTSRQYKKQIELYTASGISRGRSADKISRDVKEFLNNPDKRFRRVRDKKTGKLKLSQPAKQYHPGAGVYRSAKKNAKRLAGTETNIAYRTSDYNRVQKLNFVVGIEIRLSSRHPKADICDSMVGVYPKTYKHTGFHPQCICYAVSKKLPRDKFKEYLRTGKIDNRYKIKTIPKQALDYLENRKDKIGRMKNKPYFFQDNFKFSSDGVKPKAGVTG